MGFKFLLMFTEHLIIIIHTKVLKLLYNYIIVCYKPFMKCLEQSVGQTDVCLSLVCHLFLWNVKHETNGKLGRKCI